MTASMSARRLGRAISDTLNGNAFVRFAKNGRNAIVDTAFRHRDIAAGRRLADTLAAAGAQDVCVSIAFNTPWVVDLLTAAWRLHPVGLTLAVADNSSDAAARTANARICRARGVPYVSLPHNPEWNPCRSHGIALNWVWHNVIVPLRPRIAGFIDHDCFPTTSLDLVARMAGRAGYGLRIDSYRLPGVWTLWPGYCFLNHAAIAGRSVDFKHRVELGLDTGGGNWPAIYRHLAPEQVAAVSDGSAFLDLGSGAPPVAVQCIDGSFVHLAGASYRAQLRDPTFCVRLRDAVWHAYLGGERPLAAA